MAQTKAFLTWAKQNRVSWSFWAYVNPWRPMTFIDYATNEAIPVVKSALRTGLDDAAQPNQDPVASFSAPTTGLDVSVDGSGSSDPDGTVASWGWDFGDGSTATGPTATHTYPAPGIYTVTLTVTDDDSATDTATRNVTVTDGVSPFFVAAAAFERTVATGFGSADVGGPWTVTGIAANYSVAGGTGRIDTAAGSGHHAYLGDIAEIDIVTNVDLSLDRIATGSGAYVSLMNRRINDDNDSRLKVRFQSNGNVAAYLIRQVGGSETILDWTAAVPGITYTPGEIVQTRFEATGTGTTTLAREDLGRWNPRTPRSNPHRHRHQPCAAEPGINRHRHLPLQHRSHTRHHRTRQPQRPGPPGATSPNVAPTAAFTSTMSTWMWWLIRRVRLILMGR